MTHQPLVNAIVDVIFNEDEIRTTAYTPSNPLNDDQKVDITEESLKKILGRMPNWKSPVLDLVQGFCLNKFCNLYGRVRS